MVAYALVQRLTPNVALALAGGAGACAVLVSLVLPGALLEDLVLSSGIAAFVPAAEPPLGTTARLCIGLFAGGLIALIAWMGLSALLAWVDSRAVGEGPEGERRPTVRRADAHPDARPRVPLRASDLEVPVYGRVPDAEPVVAAPELSVTDVLDLADSALPDEPVIAMGAPSEGRPLSAPLPEVQDLPVDLSQPLAAFDPSAIPAVPMAPPPPVRPLRRRAPRAPIYDSGERFETFELTPAVRPMPEPYAAPEPEALAANPIAAPQTEASVHALLDRLERGLSKFGPATLEPEPERKLEDTLSELRRMAMRA
jgi:hypothetical protein